MKLQSTSYHPQSQGVVERFNRTMTDMLAKMVGNKQKDWIKYLTQVQLEYNGAIHATTGFSPYYLVFGQPISLSMDLLVGKRERKERLDWSKSKLVLLDNIRVATERIKVAYDKAAERWNIIEENDSEGSC